MVDRFPILYREATMAQLCYGKEFNRTDSCPDCVSSTYCRDARDLPLMRNTVPFHDTITCSLATPESSYNDRRAKQGEDTMRRIKQALTPRQFEVIELVAMNGLSYRQTGRALGITGPGAHRIAKQAVRRIPELAAATPQDRRLFLAGAMFRVKPTRRARPQSRCWVSDY